MNIDQFEKFSNKQLRELSAEAFGELLDSVPVKDRIKLWPKITPDRLHNLSVPAMEALLQRLPQCSALARRKPGQLRVLSLGFNVHIGGRIDECPFPIDFCTRVNGERAAINVMIEPGEGFTPDMLSSGARVDFYIAMSELHQKGLSRLANFNLIMLKIFRPASPGAYQLGTAGGVFESLYEAAEHRVYEETKEEFKGFQYLAWSLVVPEQIYQSGNVYELQSIGVVLGYIPNRDKIITAAGEGIYGWETVPLHQVRDYFTRLNKVPFEDPNCIRPDAKIAHGLAEIFPRLRELGFTF